MAEELSNYYFRDNSENIVFAMNEEEHITNTAVNVNEHEHEVLL